MATILSDVIAFAAIFAEVIALAAILSALTALAAIFSVVIALTDICVAVTLPVYIFPPLIRVLLFAAHQLAIVEPLASA